MSNAAMVKWYNISLPTIGREFDSLWPHSIQKDILTRGVFLYAVRPEQEPL